jgi:putative tricarboxylic transport membrane protein
MFIMLNNIKKYLSSSIIAASIATLSTAALAADLAEIHFIIPGGAGGGWDMTARGTGDVLMT